MLGIVTDVSRILNSIEHGDPQAPAELLPLVYDELRKLAAARMAAEAPGQSLQATALVHEAYVRLVDVGVSQRFSGRGHFFGAAAEAMRRILIDRARHRRSQKAGGNRHRQDIADIEPAVPGLHIDLLALNEVLDNLEKHDARAGQIFKLRFFAGLTIAEAAEAVGIAPPTAAKDWAYACCWLRLELGESVSDDSA
jgi:RNA polymerase sigma factor (TIGR02999 family)